MTCLGSRLQFQANLLVFAFSLALGACVFPTDLAEETPFRDEVNGSETGITTRAKIQAKLGEPSEGFAHGRWWLFHSDRQMTEWFGLICLPPGGCASGPFGGEERRYTLITEFDEEDVLQDAIIVDEKKPCSEDGSVCYREGQLEIAWNNASPLPNPRDTCALVIYGRTPAMKFSDAWVRVDGGDAPMVVAYLRPPTNKWSSYVRTHITGVGEPIGTLTDETYLRMYLQEGLYKLQTIVPITSDFTESIELRCVRGETHFVRLLYETPNVASLTSVEPMLGREDIRGRQLRLLQDL